jgi:hypothetical protein
VSAGATARVAAGTATTVAGLDLSAGGLVDLTTGSMAVTSGLSAAEVVAEILVGRGDGSWTGASGISSSAVAAEVAGGTPRAIGWLDHGDGAVSFAFSAPGDTNIDGVVDILDAANFLAGGAYNAGTPASWYEGDFNYDGLVNVLDAADFLSTGLYDTGSYLPRASGLAVAVVPEPATALMAATALALLACRRAARTRHPRSQIRC